MRAFDPSATLAVHCGDGSDPYFQPLSKHALEALGCRLLSLGDDMRRRDFITLLGGAPGFSIVACVSRRFISAIHRGTVLSPLHVISNDCASARWPMRIRFGTLFIFGVLGLTTVPCYPTAP